jgi:hypothetical protein
MAPALYLLPRSSLELRPLHGTQAQADVKWLLRSRDERARAMWEVLLNTPTLHALLDGLANGDAEVRAGDLQLKVYPDPEAEISVCNWAIQQLSRYEPMLARQAPVRQHPAERRLQIA